VADTWYYANGGEPKGPLSFRELIDMLSNVPDRGQTMIWRRGFENWKTVDQVPEIGAELFRPPPLPHSSAPPPIVSEPSVGAEDAARFKDVNPDLTGIAGWLIFIAIGQVLGPLRILASAAYYYGKMDKGLFERFPVTMWGEVVINVGMISLSIYTTILFFSHSRKFPRYFICELIAASALLFVDAAWVGLSLAAYTGRGAEQFVNLTPQEIAQSITTAIAGAIWIAYVLQSKRVANTFKK
jgi:hypothetical protein